MESACLWDFSSQNYLGLGFWLPVSNSLLNISFWKKKIDELFVALFNLLIATKGITFSYCTIFGTALVGIKELFLTIQTSSLQSIKHRKERGQEIVLSADPLSITSLHNMTVQHGIKFVYTTVGGF